MPLTFAAFCAHKQGLYQRYVTLRVGSPARACRLVQVTLGDLAMNWHEVLSSSSPAAESWQLLTARVAEAAGRTLRAPYDVLSRQDADVLVLRYRMGLPLGVAADLMGLDESTLTCRLHAALRTFR
ncbi:hypothetical protein [Actinacidiphila sp. bgisy144]|uniref:hypothetical protein n=1 Tax=Actinacidiphila sp. bgisy144 TaxID=3413791 RepID=UPI003EBA3512